ncbi:hypothetical protein [Kordiimonas sp.]|uniref:hypothetical protein n=1 Tax=Kordiimonas sp. TaxID=1970157 RepID=UPI003A93C5C3
MTEIDKAKADDLGVKITGSAETSLKVDLAHQNALCRIFGTTDATLANALLSQCLKPLQANEASDEHPGNDERAFMVSIVNELAPRDPVERMLAVQMAATHVATIRSARSMAYSGSLAARQAHYTGFNKLARTFAAQVEALRKHRNGGKQTVTVQHVNVSDGGQAIVGNVETAREG